MDFDVAFDRLMGNEGSYTNDPKDPGGETNFGVTWPVLREAIGLGIVPATTTIASLLREQAKAIYRALFWDQVHADELYDGVAFQALDFAVNSGVGTAIRYLQRAVGAADDGRWGPESTKAAAAVSESDTIMRLNGLRLRFMTKLKNWPAAGGGWANRIGANLLYGAEDA